MGVFRKFIEAKIAVAREPKTTSDSKTDSGPPPLKKIKLAEEVKEEVRPQDMPNCKGYTH